MATQRDTKKPAVQKAVRKRSATKTATKKILVAYDFAEDLAFLGNEGMFADPSDGLDRVARDMEEYIYEHAGPLLYNAQFAVTLYKITAEPIGTYKIAGIAKID